MPQSVEALASEMGAAAEYIFATEEDAWKHHTDNGNDRAWPPEKRKAWRAGFGYGFRLARWVFSSTARDETIATLSAKLVESEAREGALSEAVQSLAQCLLPVHMGLMEREMVGDPIPAAAVVLSFMGSGASDSVTAHEVTEALDQARAALPLKGRG